MVLPMTALCVKETDAVISTKHQPARRQRHHHVDMAAPQALPVSGLMLIYSHSAADGTGNVNTTRIGTHDNVPPRVNDNGVDSVAMQHTACLLAVIKQHTARSVTIASRLVYAGTVDT